MKRQKLQQFGHRLGIFMAGIIIAAGTLSPSRAQTTPTCAPTYSDGGYLDGLTHVTFGALSDVPPVNNSPYYFDRSAVQNIVPDVPKTVATNLILTFGADPSQYNGVWIDFNNNGVFETTEFFSSNSNAGANGTVTIPVTLPATAVTGNVYMRIRGGDDVQPTSVQACGASGSGYGMGLDYKVNITAATSCIQPASTSYSNVSAQTATISWNASASALGGYEYYWNTTNIPPSASTSATGSVGAGVVTANLAGLAVNTEHYFWVRSLCSSNSRSAWTAVDSFKTTCMPVTTLPWTETFDGMSTVGATSFPSCWTKEYGYWSTTNDGPSSIYAGPYSPNNSLQKGYGTGNDYMWTPGFLLTAGISYDFSFYWAGDANSGWQGDVYRNTSPTGTGASQMGASFVVGTTTTTMNYQKVTRTFMPTTTGTYFFAIKANAAIGSTWHLAFDNFQVKQSPNCSGLYVNLGSDTTACENTTVTLNAGNAGSTYLWNTGDTTQMLAATTTGSYSVTVNMANGCTLFDTVAVNFNALPVVTLGNDTAICADDTLTLDAGNSGATYLWSNGATAQTTNVYAAGSYHVTVTNTAGCIGHDTMNLSINPLPSANAITVSGTSPNFTFSVSNGQHIDTYLWNFGDNTSTSSNASPVHTYATAGTYTVTVTLSNACGSITITKQVTVQGNSVKDLDLDEAVLKLYPNPAQQSIVVENESNMHMKDIQVYNMLGQLVTTHKVSTSNGKQVIDVSHLANGMYHMRIRFTEGSAERKFEVLR